MVSKAGRSQWDWIPGWTSALPNPKMSGPFKGVECFLRSQHPLKNFPKYYAARNVNYRAHHFQRLVPTLSQQNPVHNANPVSLGSILILYSHLCLCMGVFSFLPVLPRKNYMHFTSFAYMLYDLPILFSVVLVRERTILTERPLLVGEVRANFCGWSVAWSVRRIPTAVCSVFETGAATLSFK
jgi:hypothetical protein